MRRFLIIAALLSMAVASFAQTAAYTPNYQYANPGRMLGGEHTWLILRGSDTWTVDDGLDSTVTDWFNFSVSDSSSMNENSEVFDFDGDIMNLDISVESAGDSIGVSKIIVEFGWDNIGWKPIRNADSTFNVMADGNYNLALYAGNGGYLYEDVPGRANSTGGFEDFQWRYKIPVQGAAWCRIKIFSATDIADNVDVAYTISITH